MAKNTAPLLSFGASGQIGDTLVYSKWRGVNYTRQKVTPTDPNTTEQQITRNAFQFLQRVYKTAPALFTAPWAAYASGKALTDRNAFTKFNLPGLRGESDLTNFVGSPGALGGLPPLSIVVTPGDDQLAVAVNEPTVLPSGWTIQAAVVAVIREQDPDSGTLYTISAGEDLTDAYSVTLTGLASAQTYQVRAWMRYVRDDGKIAYSPSIDGTGLTT